MSASVFHSQKYRFVYAVSKMKSQVGFLLFPHCLLTENLLSVIIIYSRNQILLRTKTMTRMYLIRSHWCIAFTSYMLNMWTSSMMTLRLRSILYLKKSNEQKPHILQYFNEMHTTKQCDILRAFLSDLLATISRLPFKITKGQNVKNSNVRTYHLYVTTQWMYYAIVVEHIQIYLVYIK